MSKHERVFSLAVLKCPKCGMKLNAEEASRGVFDCRSLECQPNKIKGVINRLKIKGANGDRISVH